MPEKFTTEDWATGKVKYNLFNALTGGPALTRVVAKKPKPELVEVDLAAYKATCEAEFKIREQAKREAKKARKAEEARERAEAEKKKAQEKEDAEKQKLYEEKKRQERHERHRIEHEKRKAAEKARRENFPFTAAQTKKMLSMAKEGKSWDEIASELGNDVSPEAAKKHYEFINEITVVVKLDNTNKGNGGGNGNGNGKSNGNDKPNGNDNGNGKANGNDKANGNGNGNGNGKAKEMTDEELVEAGKEAEAKLKAKADAQKHKDDKVNNRGSGDNSGSGVTFSKKQINKIMGMKKSGKSWAEIADAIGNGATAQDVKKQWKELNPDADDDDDNGGDDNWNVFGTDIAQEATPAKNGNGKNGNKNGGKANNSNGNNGNNFNGNGNSNGTWAVGNNGNRYLAAALEEPEYSNKLQPDEHFSGFDCDILEMLLLREQEQKWSRIQAGFRDCTGRMVPIWMLQAKVREML